MFLAAVLPGTSGCVTMMVMEKANKTTTEGYVVNKVEGAWLGENGDLTVCLLGLAPDRSGADFSISIPARGLAAPAEAGAIAAYRVPPARIVTPCGPPPAGARAIPVESVAAVGDPGLEREPDWEQVWEQDPEQEQETDREQENNQEQGQDIVTMPEYMDLDTPGAKIYKFEETETGPGATVLYRHATPLPGGTRFTRLDIPVKETQPNAALGLLVPVALALDVFLVYLCLHNATDCFSSM